MSSDSPLLIAVAPNGARRGKKDHLALPLTAVELARCAVDCAAAGAAMLHLHVRNHGGRHSLAPQFYRQALREVRAAVGERLLLQVTSEAAGRYRTTEQMALMRRLAPSCLSCGLREFVAGPETYGRAASFFRDLQESGSLLQIILYSPEEVRWYEELCRAGVLPDKCHFLLFVLGRYGEGNHQAAPLGHYLAALERPSPWMACAFGLAEHRMVEEAARLGGHVRVGFENNLHLADGRLAPDNSALVAAAAASARDQGRTLADPHLASTLFQH
jgi:3-keto-5-aminohexanoate cleavage enzyme